MSMPDESHTGPDNSSDRDSSKEGRVRAARIVLVVSGLVSLLLFWAVPFMDAGAFYHVVIQPAYELPTRLGSDDIPSTTPRTETMLNALHVDTLLETYGDPLPARNADDEDVPLTPIETFIVAEYLHADSSLLGEFETETQITARYLLLATAMYVVVGVICTLLPLLRRPDAIFSNVLTGASALLLLATHLLAAGIDLAGVIEGGLFTWQAHVLSVLIVVGAAVGTGLPLGAKTALPVALGTLGLFVVSAIGTGIWIAV